MLLLVAVLVVAGVAARSCAAHDQEVSKEEAIEIAKEHASITPCEEPACVVVRAIQRGIPTRLVWIVGLAESLDDEGRPDPARVVNVLVDAQTGEIVRR